MMNLVLKSLKSGNVDTIYFDNFKIENVNSYEIIPHNEENIIEFKNGNELYGGETIFINLNSVVRIKFESQPQENNN